MSDDNGLVSLVAWESYKMSNVFVILLTLKISPKEILVRNFIEGFNTKL